MRHPVLALVLVLAVSAPTAAAPPQQGHDFTAEGRALLRVGACGDGPAPAEFLERYVTKHCTIIDRAQEDYRTKWVSKARPFFADHVPADVPKKVVYPFSGGDLSTALTVYPDADEITTLSLEPAGDPRTLAALSTPVQKAKSQMIAPGLERALGTIRDELRFLYTVNFSNTMNMINAMRSGMLPTQLVFGLSALKIHGFEVVALRYFSLDEAGTIRYLSDAEVAAAPDVLKGKADTRNRVFANAEVQFRKPGGRVQIYRHLQVNLDDAHMKKDPRVIKHLAAKGPVAAMTKAASYLLSWPGFSTIRTYLTDHAVWMVSDATGVPPKIGKAAGFEYETYGRYELSHMDGGKGVEKEWREEWAQQPRRDLPFRFGYYDGTKSHSNHLVIMRKKKS
ncbi:MAG: hypothetical protein JWP01_750 [Myxococcales bacterium]|nr:hypothetical protein [Myxococcales bacterium]